jgi:predicted GIY-YIG superfamily endonuclease
LVYSEDFPTKQEAQSREFAIKRLSRQEKERLIEKSRPARRLHIDTSKIL